MATKTQLRIGQVIAKIDTTAAAEVLGSAADLAGQGTLDSKQGNVASLNDVLQIMADSIARINGKEEWSNSAAGVFAQDIKIQANEPIVTLADSQDDVGDAEIIGGIKVTSAHTVGSAVSNSDVGQLVFVSDGAYSSSNNKTDLQLKLGDGNSASDLSHKFASAGEFYMYDADADRSVGFRPTATTTNSWMATLPDSYPTALGQSLTVASGHGAGAEPVLAWSSPVETCLKEIKDIGGAEKADLPLLFTSVLGQADLFDFNGKGTAADVFLNGQLLRADKTARDKEMQFTNPDGDEAHAFQMAGQAMRFNRADATGQIFVFVDPPFQNRGAAVRGTIYNFDPETAPDNAAETIALPNCDLLVGDQVLYTVLSGATVGGLSTGSVYWVLATAGAGAGTTITLASTEAIFLAAGSAIDITQAASAGTCKIQRVSIRSGDTLAENDRIGLLASSAGAGHSITVAAEALTLLDTATDDSGATLLVAKHNNLIGAKAIVPPRIAANLDNLKVGHYFQELFKLSGELDTFMNAGANIAKIERPGGETSDGAKLYKLHGGAGNDADWKFSSIKRHNTTLDGATSITDGNRLTLATGGVVTQAITDGVNLENANADYYQSRKQNNAICFTFGLESGDSLQLVVRGE